MSVELKMSRLSRSVLFPLLISAAIVAAAQSYYALAVYRARRPTPSEITGEYRLTRASQAWLSAELGSPFDGGSLELRPDRRFSFRKVPDFHSTKPLLPGTADFTGTWQVVWRGDGWSVEMRVSPDSVPIDGLVCSDRGPFVIHIPVSADKALHFAQPGGDRAISPLTPWLQRPGCDEARS